MTSGLEKSPRGSTKRSVSAKGQSTKSLNSRSYECVSIRPDGGMAWLVVVASFVSVMMIISIRKEHLISLR